MVRGVESKKWEGEISDWRTPSAGKHGVACKAVRRTQPPGGGAAKLIGLRSSPGRGEWLGRARVQMRSNGRASQRHKNDGIFYHEDPWVAG